MIRFQYYRFMHVQLHYLRQSKFLQIHDLVSYTVHILHYSFWGVFIVKFHLSVSSGQSYSLHSSKFTIVHTLICLSTFSQLVKGTQILFVPLSHHTSYRVCRDNLFMFYVFYALISSFKCLVLGCCICHQLEKILSVGSSDICLISWPCMAISFHLFSKARFSVMTFCLQILSERFLCRLFTIIGVLYSHHVVRLSSLLQVVFS